MRLDHGAAVHALLKRGWQDTIASPARPEWGWGIVQKLGTGFLPKSMQQSHLEHFAGSPYLATPLGMERIER